MDRLMVNYTPQGAIDLVKGSSRIAPQPQPTEARGSNMLSRRNFIIGMIAAPAIIRTPGLLMPVRDRTLHRADFIAEIAAIIDAMPDPPGYDGAFDHANAEPPSLAEVIAWRKGMHDLLSRCMVSWTAEGFNRIHVMCEAEKRYKAMRLL
jgi:hypothetical protein